MVGLLRHRQTKGPVSARPHLNRRATPRLHLIMALRWALECNRLISSTEMLLYILRASEERMPQFRLFIALFVVAWSAPLTTAQGSSKPSPAKEAEPRLETVVALKNPFLQGQVRTYYTPGFEK